MNAVVAGPALAVQINAGATGFFVVVLLCIAAAGIFVMMSRSLKRMRSNVASGEFHGTDTRPDPRFTEGERVEARVPAQDDPSAHGDD